MVVQAYMGHASINTTLKYTKVEPAALLEAARHLPSPADQAAGNGGVTQVDLEEPSLISLSFLEASPGIEPGCKDLQSSA